MGFLVYPNRTDKLPSYNESIRSRPYVSLPACVQRWHASTPTPRTRYPPFGEGSQALEPSEVF
jgi:hypothetical protein